MIKDHSVDRSRHKNYNPRANMPLLVDLSNILYDDLDYNRKLKVSNIIKLGGTLLLKGYRPLLILDASKRYQMDNTAYYERLVEKGIVHQAPAGRTADIFILKLVREYDCKFLSNDQFKQYWGQFGKEWVLSHRITSMYLNGQFIID